MPLWILDHLDDLESDFSVFHRIDNMYDLPAREFLAKAVRISAYAGVIQARQQEESEREENGMQQSRAAQVAPRPSSASVSPRLPAPAKELTPALAVGEGYGAEGQFPAIVEWGGN